MLPQVDELARVVVCEDDEATRELLCDQLTADRYRALPAPSASDALRLCGYNSPDLMVLDLVLPDAAGIDVLRQIRSAEGASDRFDPQLPVIVLSAAKDAALGVHPVELKAALKWNGKTIPFEQELSVKIEKPEEKKPEPKDEKKAEGKP